MFTNFTEETCTGVGDTLTLAGAVTGKLPFSLSFNDGELVSYTLEDSGNSIKVTGIGTYNSSGDTITRNDNWNYNGTVIDKNPSTNIALSGGTHEIRCDSVAENIQVNASYKLDAMSGSHDALPDNWINPNDSNSLPVANTVAFIAAYYASPVEFNTLQVGVLSSSATDVVQIGICSCGLNGLPDPDGVIEIVTVDVTSAGDVLTSLSQTHKIPAGRYFVFISNKDASAGFWRIDQMTHAMRAGSYVFRGGQAGQLRSGGAVNGIITTPLVAPNAAGDPLDNLMVLPRMI